MAETACREQAVELGKVSAVAGKAPMDQFIGDADREILRGLADVGALD